MIIEDDRVIADALKEHLERWDYQVICVAEFQHVLEQFLEELPQMVLLDISLPSYSGYHWCSEIRKHSKVPIIFISSASDNMNIVMAMNMGADDFLAKPFDLAVAVAKIQALFRRAYSFAGHLNLIVKRGVILNLEDQTAHFQDEKIELTKNEFKILQILLENIGKSVARETIMTCLWENDSFIDDNTLTVNVARLRKKLEQIGLKDFIITKKGIGYFVAAE